MPPFLVDFIVSSLIVVLLTLFIAIKINRLTTWVYYGVTDIIFIVAFLFGMDILTIVDSPLHHGRVHHLLLHQLRFLRKYIAIPLKNTKTKFKTESKEYDKEKIHKRRLYRCQLAEQKQGWRSHHNRKENAAG